MVSQYFFLFMLWKEELQQCVDHDERLFCSIITYYKVDLHKASVAGVFSCQWCSCFMQFGSGGSCTSISLLSQSLHVDCPLSAGSWAKTMDGLMHGWMTEKLATHIFISKF